MLRAAAFPAPCNSMSLHTLGATQTDASLSMTFTSKANFSLLSGATLCFRSSAFLSSVQQFQQCRLNSLVLKGNGLGVGAVKKGGQSDGVGLMEMDDFDDEDDGDFFDEDGDVDGEEDVVLPVEQMKNLLKNKPRGFGVGKVYDTSIEDKLLEEIQQSEKAQAANINKLKNDPVKASSKKNDQNKTAPEIVRSGVRVRLLNLPKKKNIHRDLKSAFQGIPGIIDIIPVVSGNKKTRDPICRGFAFVDFKCEEDAAMFVQLYSGQSIAFGKIQKQINCELLKSQSSSSAGLELSETLNTAPQLVVPAFEDYPSEGYYLDDPALNSWDGVISYDSGELGKQIDTEEVEDFEENEEPFAALEADSDDDAETNLLSSEQESPSKLKMENVSKKKSASKDKAKKLPKLDVPGSAKRLKIKEKAVLSDVFSKYGLKSTLVSKDNS
ncbi:hypothetical protein L6164_027206 [Bauhinia variegata]|uniref:Uncharacterized protein n=1 Tax=Bauhinia variegata TaxID=167791 RepID=A0ACB9LSG4_BAUVA|nr:hypothetical protein L6164_027206 [Bauhinia variegata]